MFFRNPLFLKRILPIGALNFSLQEENLIDDEFQDDENGPVKPSEYSDGDQTEFSKYI